MRKARWAILNVATICQRTIIEMKESDVLEVVAVCSRSMEKAKKFSEEHQIPSYYDNQDEMLARDDIDIVYIPAPTYLHAELSMKCMNAGKNVLCEKPIANSSREAELMFECARKNNVFLAEGIWTNYFPAMKQTMKWIRDGRIGTPKHLYATFGTNLPNLRRYPPQSWDERPELGGGALCCLGCYCSDLATMVFGSEPEEILGSCKLAGPGGVDTHGTAILNYNGRDQHAMISTSSEVTTPIEAQIYGTEGNIVLGKLFFAPFSCALYTPQGHMGYNDLLMQYTDPYSAKHREGFRYQFDAVSKYVLEGKKESEEVSPEFSIQCARVLEGIRRSWGFDIPEPRIK